MPVVNYLWNPLNDNIVREFDDSGTVIAEYTTEANQFGNVVCQRRNGQDSVYHYDGQGSTLALTNANGDVTDTYAYSAFGEVTSHTGSTVNPFQVIGQGGYYLDTETGMYEVRKRLLGGGRWLSMDPVESANIFSKYVYAANSPVMFTDPSGLFVVCATYKSGSNTWTEEIDCGNFPTKLGEYTGYFCSEERCLVTGYPGSNKNELAKNCVSRRASKFIWSWTVVKWSIGKCRDTFFVQQGSVIQCCCCGFTHVDLISRKSGTIRYGLYGSKDVGPPSPQAPTIHDTILRRKYWDSLYWGISKGKDCLYASDADIISCIQAKPAPTTIPQFCTGDPKEMGDCFTNCRTDIADSARECCLVGF